MMIDLFGFSHNVEIKCLMDGRDISSFRVTELIQVNAAVMERGNSLKLAHITDIFFDPITSASTVTTVVTLKMEAVRSFVH